MRWTRAVLLLLGLLAAGCGRKAVELPENPTDGPSGPPRASGTAPASPTQLPES